MIWTLFLVVPSVIFFGMVVLTFGISDALLRPFWLKRRLLGPVSGWAKLNFARWVLWAHRVEVEYLGPGLDELRKPRSYIYVANHQSLLDIPALMKFLTLNSCFVAKKELSYIPIFGWAGFLIGTIFIDRKRGAQNKNLEKVLHYLKSGISIIFFPEGTRSLNEDLGEFKKGAFVFAIQSQTDIIPISIDNSANLLSKTSWSIKPGKIRVYIDRPISAKDLKIEDRARMAGEARNLIAKNLEVLRESRKNSL